MTMTIADTLDAERCAERTAQSSPATFADVTDTSPNLEAAKAAIAEQEAAQRAEEEARARRDQAIVRLATEDGWNPPKIAGALSMSVSNVRLALRLAGVGTARHGR